jgi:2,5-furandicarboxylate decarboxylase 1
MMGTDLHSFLQTHKGEYLEIEKSVNLDYVPALIAQAEDTIVFNQIKGYPGFRLVDLLFCNRKAQARVLRCDPREVVKSLTEVMRRGPRPLREVPGGPCQERIFTGDQIDLGMLPIPRHTAEDAYPYATGFAVHRDPDTGKFNQMYPRSGVLSRNEMVTSFVTATANQYLAKNRQKGTRMPQAVVIGAHPAWELAGCYSHPHDDWWEAELFETISGKAGEVTRCKTLDLLVPADASIIIEGYVNPQRLAQDGPNPGPNMLFCPYIQQQPVFEVTAITMRKDPIYRHHQVTPFTDHQEMPRLFHEAILYERLRAMGLKVHDVYIPQGGATLCVIIQVEPTYDGHVTDGLLAVLGSPWMNTKMAIAVDPDINIYDYRDVIFALSTRVDPAKDVFIIRNARAFPFDPSAQVVPNSFPNAEQTRFPSVVGKWGIDATKPVPYRAAERKLFERAWPAHWGKVKLEDYLK